MPERGVSFNLLTLALIALVTGVGGAIVGVGNYMAYRLAREAGEEQAPGAKLELPSPPRLGEDIPTPQEAIEVLKSLGLTPEEVLRKFLSEERR